MLSDETRERVVHHLTTRFGCDSGAIAGKSLYVVGHGAGFRGWSGAYALRNLAGGVILTVPYPDLMHVQSTLHGIGPESLFDGAQLEALFPRRVDRIVGPASLAYVDEETFVPSRTPGVRLLDHKDAAKFAELRDDCDRVEWEHGDVELGRNPVFGAFEDGRIIAVASWDTRGDVANVGVVTHPAYRRRGLGRAVASATTAHLLAAGELPQWQTLVDNAASIAVGRALGYTELYQSIAVRLRA